jgi:glycosyltransferase involved in cell wall biosynthesis
MPHFDLLWQAGASGGLSSVIMEAMAAGVPVAATDTASNRELMVDQETGYLVPLGDRAGLGRRANQVLDDPRLSARLGAAARQRMASEFTVQTMVAAHAALYREMME